MVLEEMTIQEQSKQEVRYWKNLWNFFRCSFMKRGFWFPLFEKSLFWFLFDVEPMSNNDINLSDVELLSAETDKDVAPDIALPNVAYSSNNAPSPWHFWRICKDWTQAFLYMFVFYMAFTIVFAEAYQIPSGSMEPTFHGDINPAKGDRVLAWKGISVLDEFQRGDIIIFISVEDQSTFIVKRLVGLPGDKVQIKQGKVFINDEQLKGGAFDELTYYLPRFYYNEHNELVYSSLPQEGVMLPPINMIKTIYTPKDLYANLNSEDPKKREECLKKIHQYQIGPFPCFGQNPIIVPKDCYFVLGDNSLHSNDSRYWGWVPKRNVLGKATMIWWPLFIPNIEIGIKNNRPYFSIKWPIIKMVNRGRLL